MPIAGRLSLELDYGGGVEFRHQASDLILEQPCSGVSVLHPWPCQFTWTSDVPIGLSEAQVLQFEAPPSKPPPLLQSRGLKKGEMHPQAPPPLWLSRC